VQQTNPSADLGMREHRTPARRRVAIALVVTLVLTAIPAHAGPSFFIYREIPSGGFYPECARASVVTFAAPGTVTRFAARTQAYYSDDNLTCNRSLGRNQYWLYAKTRIFSFTYGYFCGNQANNTFNTTWASVITTPSLSSSGCGGSYEAQGFSGYYWAPSLDYRVGGSTA
jgi:hypothetical protein